MEDKVYVSVDDLPALKILYKKAVEDGATEFIYKGWPVLVNYAKYLIEYLESLTNRRLKG